MAFSLGISGALVGIGAAALVCRAALIRRMPKPVPLAELDVDTVDIIVHQNLSLPVTAATVQSSASTDTTELPIPSEIDWEDLGETYRPELLTSAEFSALHDIFISPDDKKNEPFILIRKSVLDQIQTHLRSDTSVEKGGLLIGQAYFDDNNSRYLLKITDQFEANDGVETSSTFTYTPSTWERLLPKLQNLSQNTTILGSYHSHPDMGVFLSSTDMETQTEIFNANWQVAMVVDPVSSEVGFFVGMEGIRCDNWLMW